ncbi:MAG: cell division protein ZapE [Aliidiomarina sp.]|uniref:cell division protein ZapE n=1 Tax=Aliidiomarina sp. TaxID=1872439 RepID=UPI0025C12D21|nr:cell division protein ZapE [Aliidiomarina sp.]MCH8502125.1 cell division protein ZapE [Aliidiomarina sp.]
MLNAYQQLSKSQTLRFDGHQALILLSLHRLGQNLNQQNASQKGVYLYGPVGRGKTMLMDLFFQHCSEPRKIRLHYHHFMKRVHLALNQISGQENPLTVIAAQWAEDYRLICLDEFFVEDMGDAMILGRLWQALFNNGVTLVTTSNSRPEELYKNGLGRDRFLPTIHLLNQHCTVLSLDHPTDYRRSANNTESTLNYYWQSSTPTSTELMAEIRQSLQLSSPIEPGHLDLLGREVPFLWRTQTAIALSFEALCMGPRSQRDYMELAAQYKVMVVIDVPRFSYTPTKAIVHGVEETYQREDSQQQFGQRDDAARRFMALVDECYEQSCLVVVSSDTAIDELYQGKELAQPFARCASRLHEMQTWPLPSE